MNCSFSPQISDSNAEPPAVKWQTTSQLRPAKCIVWPTAVLGNRPTSFLPTQTSARARTAGVRPSRDPHVLAHLPGALADAAHHHVGELRRVAADAAAAG